MAKSPGKLRVLLLAPIRAVGGITIWGRILRKYTDRDLVEYEWLDTSKLFEDLGLRGAILGLRDAVVRFFDLMSRVRRFRPDLVYFTCVPYIGLPVRDAPLMLILSLMGVPTLAHLRAGDAEGFFGGGFVRRRLVRAAFRRCRAIIPITRPVERAAKEIFDPQKVIYIPNMIDDDMPGLQAQRPIRTAGSDQPLRLLHVAWQDPAKGSLELVEAVSRLPASVQCDLVGDVTPENQRLIQGRIEQLGLAGRVHLRGRKQGEELWGFYRQADVFVFPSHSEGFPNAILEALAWGLPIIATDVGSIREMADVDGDHPAAVLLAPPVPADAGQLAQEIDRLLSDAEKRGRMSRDGQSRAKQYCASVVVPRLENLLCCLCGVGPRGAGQAQSPDAPVPQPRPTQAAQGSKP